MIIPKFVRYYFEKVIGPHHVLMTAISLLVTLLAGFVIATTWNINSDFKALLPKTSEASIAMDEVSQRVGSGSTLFVVIDSPDPEANLRFAADYAKALLAIPEVALAHYHNDKSFFEKNALLYLPAKEIDTLADRLEERIKEEKKNSNPFFVGLKKKPKKEIQIDDLGGDAKERVQDNYKEYFISEDGYSLTLVVRFVEASSDLLSTNNLLAKVRETGHNLHPETYQPEMTIELGGGLVNRESDYNSILHDIVVSAIFTVLGLFFVIALFFRRLRSILLILGPLVMSILWTLAIAFVIFGELTIVTTFIFAILLGLGIDFAIHFLHAYDEERENGREPLDALMYCYANIGLATILGALTTFAVFVVLSFADFRGLSQFGTTAGIGILSAAFAMVTTQPAMLLTLQKIWPVHVHPGEPTGLRRLSPAHWLKTRHLRKASLPILGLTVICSILSAWAMPWVSFQENFSEIGKIEPPWIAKAASTAAPTEQSAEHAAREVAAHVRARATDIRESISPDTFVRPRKQKTIGDKYSSAVGKMYSSVPTILLFDKEEDAARVTNLIAELLEKGELPAIQSAVSIHSFMPGSAEEQKKRVDAATRIKGILEREGTAFLSKKQKEQVEELRPKLDITPVTVHELPEWAKRLFRESGSLAKAPKEGEAFSFEYLVYVNSGVATMDGEKGRLFLSNLERIRKESGTQFKIASSAYVYISMLNEIQYEGTLFLGVALLLVLIIITLAFRSLARGVVASIPLVFGLFWSLGLSGWLGVRLDFFNVVVLPVVVGIGIDDGLQLYYRYLRLGRGSMGEALGHVSMAITLTTITSLIGFGGLASTSYPGLESMGALALIGLSMVYLSTVLILPALVILSEKWNLTWITAKLPNQQDGNEEGIDAKKE